jgi:hypothetical protein
MENEDVVERYLDVLQNIEHAVVRLDKVSDDLTDMEVADVLDNLMRAYTAEANGRSAPFMRLSPLKRQVYDAIKATCEWRMGRETLVDASDRSLPKKKGPEPDPIPLDVLLACLKRIRLSVKRWNGSNGRRGYLEYIHDFLP